MNITQNFLHQLKVTGLTAEQCFARLTEQFAIKCKHYDCGITLCDYDQISSPKSHPIVMECRSMILRTEDFSIVSRKFPRFFNLGEVPEYYEDFDWKNALVMSKEDGSLIGCYHFNGKWHISTRGMAFGEGNNQLNDGTFAQDVITAFGFKSYDEFNDYFLRHCFSDITYVFEYCSPRNRIVTPYAESVMVLTGAFPIDGREFVYSTLSGIVRDMQHHGLSVRMPKTYSMTDNPQELIQKANELDGLQEGFVVWDQKSGKRCKIKAATYLIAHSLRGNDPLPTRKNLLKLQFSGDADEFCAYFPEWKDSVRAIESEVSNTIQQLNCGYDATKDIETQKEFALAIKNVKYNGILFTARKTGKTVQQVFHDIPVEKKVSMFLD